MTPMLDELTTVEAGSVCEKDLSDLIISFSRAAGNGDIEFIKRTLNPCPFDINQRVVSFLFFYQINLKIS